MSTYEEKFLKNPVRVLSQSVSISAVSFNDKSLILYTEISLVPLQPGLKKIYLNIGKYCLLPNEVESFTGKVTINDVEANYYRNQLPPRAASPRRNTTNLNDIAENIASEYDLTVEVPDELKQDMEDQVVIRVGVDCKVENPKAGLHFVAREDDEAGNHLYTYRSNVLSSTHEWLPCLNSPNQLALWNFDITVESALTVVCSGDLIDTEMLPDMSEKTYHYQLLVPTSAVNIGLAIGNFQPFVIPEMSEITCFSLPELMPLVKHTVYITGKIFEFFEELLSCRFPYNSYKQVFVDQVPDEITSFSSLSILSINVLYHKKIIDVVQANRQKLAYAIAQQFFSCFISPLSWKDAWLTRSLAIFLSGLYVEKHFGASEYLHLVNQLRKDICHYEEIYGKIVMYPRNIEEISHLHFDSTDHKTCSAFYAEAMFKKGHFLLRVLLKRLRKEPFFKVLHRIINVAMQFSQNHEQPSDWNQMILSVDTFFGTITNVTGVELPSFIDTWIRIGGHADFELSYNFNRKRNIIEMEIHQQHTNQPGKQSYVGPLTIVVQELDGSFPHTVQIDGNVSKHDLPCHSKGRRQKRKRVPLSTGEEVEIDLTNMDPESPIMWIRVDPEMMLIRKASIRQLNQQLEYMLLYEKDIVSQIEAIETLQHFPDAQCMQLFQEAIENDKFYYRVRCQATRSLIHVQNSIVIQQPLMANQNALVNLFQRYYGCKSAPYIPVSNNFMVTSTNLQAYYLMQRIPQSLGEARSPSRQCPTDIVNFLLGLLKYNDNSTNRYSDEFYRASLFQALANTITKRETDDQLVNEPLPDTLSQEVANILTEVTHALNMDTLKPSYARVVAMACIETIAVLQRFNHLPLDFEFFWMYISNEHVYTPLRLKASYSLIKLLLDTKKFDTIENIIKLIDLSLEDPNPHIRYGILQNLCDVLVRFVYQADVLRLLNAPPLKNKILRTINAKDLEPNIKNYLLDFLYLLSLVDNPPVLRKTQPIYQPPVPVIQNLPPPGWNPNNPMMSVPSTSFNPNLMRPVFSNAPQPSMMGAKAGMRMLPSGMQQGMPQMVPMGMGMNPMNNSAGWNNPGVPRHSNPSHANDGMMIDERLE